MQGSTLFVEVGNNEQTGLVVGINSSNAILFVYKLDAGVNDLSSTSVLFKLSMEGSISIFFKMQELVS